MQAEEREATRVIYLLYRIIIWVVNDRPETRRRRWNFFVCASDGYLETGLMGLSDESAGVTREEKVSQELVLVFSEWCPCSPFVLVYCSIDSHVTQQKIVPWLRCRLLMFFRCYCFCLLSLFALLISFAYLFFPCAGMCHPENATRESKRDTYVHSLCSDFFLSI